ncbi:MAG: hypothetical protein LBI02_09870, partial [Opitutaceae bacterium]|nr:hypothetical protein [Opitutaceae bacterium]
MNPDNTHHVAKIRHAGTPLAPEPSRNPLPAAPGPRRRRRLSSPVLPVAALMLAASLASLPAQPVISSNTSSSGITVNHTTGGTLTISATVISMSNYALQIATNSAMVINTTGGRIESGVTTAGLSAVNFNTSGTLLNAGVIFATADGFNVDGVIARQLITGSNSGLIRGVRYGMQFANGAAGSVFTNSGTITGNTAGILSYGKLTGTNTGLIEGGGQYGLYLNNLVADGSDITNSGTIRASTAAPGQGFTAAAGTVVTVTNSSSGLIEGNRFGILFYGGGTITNHGVISGTTDNTGQGIRASSTTAIKNTGLVQGGQYGIYFNTGTAAGSTVVNTGTIRSVTHASGRGITASADAAITVTNSTSGLIAGNGHGVYLDTGGGTFFNAGAITAAATNGVGLLSAGKLTGTNTGLIQGNGSHGINLSATTAAGSTITNSGTIRSASATGYGIQAYPSNIALTPIALTN